MTKTELTRRVTANMTATKEALQLIWDNLNHGQQQKLVKVEEVKTLLVRYGIIEG